MSPRDTLRIIDYFGRASAKSIGGSGIEAVECARRKGGTLACESP